MGQRGQLRRCALACAASVLALAAFTSPSFALKEKPFIEPVLEEPADGTAADFSASRVTYDPRTKQAIATGTVKIVYGPYVLNASKVTYNEKTGVFEADGSVVLREPNGNVMEAATLALANKFKEGFARHLKALLTNDVTIKAQYAERHVDGITVFETASYTACKDCDVKDGVPLWELASDQTTHDQKEKMLYHVNPRLKIAGHTVFGLPYFAHPDPSVKRKTGWLYPEFKTSDVMGVGVVTPYFWALAPNYDLTARPMITTRQGPVADLEWRHRLSNGMYTLRGMGVYELSPDRSEAESRWRGAVKTTGLFSLDSDDVWKLSWDGTLQSDRNFLNDYEYDDENIIKSEVALTGLWDRNYVSAKALHFESADDDVDNNYLPTALPYITGEYYLSDNVMGGDVSLNWSAYSISRDDSNTPYTDINHGTQQTRAMAELRWRSEFISDGGLVMKPFARVRGDVYFSENVPDPTVPSGQRDLESASRVLPAAGVDLRYPLIANYSFGQAVLSPVAQVIAATDETDTDIIGNEDAITVNFDHTSLFLEDRFTGYDRYEGGLRANVGLTYALYGANGGFIRASMGESFHLAGENSFATGSGLEGSQSDLVAAVLFQPWDSLSLSYEIRAEEDLSAINRQEALLGLTFDSFSANIGYTNIAAEPSAGRNVDEEWVAADLRVGLSDGWSVFGGARYDIENANLDKRTIGLEFDRDCMNFKMSYSAERYADDTETDHKVMMSIDFATLGGTSVSGNF
ncbi:MAG: LPS assembly protein LptD [Proteobacteria bacterium]|nr:LPS assembly protein LptD [Pseudomonadota bacterium]